MLQKRKGINSCVTSYHSGEKKRGDKTALLLSRLGWALAYTQAPVYTQAPAATTDCNWISGKRLEKHLALCLLLNACLLPELTQKNSNPQKQHIVENDNEETGVVFQLLPSKACLQVGGFVLHLTSRQRVEFQFSLSLCKAFGQPCCSTTQQLSSNKAQYEALRIIMIPVLIKIIRDVNSHHSGRYLSHLSPKFSLPVQDSGKSLFCFCLFDDFTFANVFFL